jgi:hypothetical protein
MRNPPIAFTFASLDHAGPHGATRVVRLGVAEDVGQGPGDLFVALGTDDSGRRAASNE